MPRRRAPIAITIGIVGALVVAFFVFAGIYADVLWYQQLGFVEQPELDQGLTELDAGLIPIGKRHLVILGADRTGRDQQLDQTPVDGSMLGLLLQLVPSGGLHACRVPLSASAGNA